MPGSWFITRDHRDRVSTSPTEGNWINATGVTGSDWESYHGIESGARTKRAFRLYSDAGVLIFEGIQLLSDNPDIIELTSPLYEFGLPLAGASRMIYEENGLWKIQS